MELPLIGSLIEWMAPLGAWAPIAYCCLFVVAALIGVPAWTLTITAGALFGPLIGFFVSSISAAIAGAIGFLIARYLARKPIERWAKKRRVFRAIDEAIEEGDWRVVALIRLSPIVPYVLSNYLFGVTAVRFWPYVLAGWLAQAPGVLMYVLIGHLGRSTLGKGGLQSGQWVLIGVGLAATLAVVVYLTRLARKHLSGIDGVGERGEQSAQAPRAAP